MMAAHRRLLPGEPREAGITLIELLVYMVLAVLVLLIVGGLLINTLKFQRTVGAATEATTAGQLVSQSIGRGVRNANAIDFNPAPNADGQTQLIRVRTAVAGAGADLRVPAGWMCQAWYYGAGEIRTITSTTAIPTPTSVSSWTLLATGVQPLPVSPATVPTTTTPVLSGSGGQVTLRTQVSTGDGKPTLIRTSWSSRQPVPTTGAGSLSCF